VKGIAVASVPSPGSTLPVGITRSEGEPDLSALADEIRREHEATEAAFSKAMDHALRCGDLLIQVKETLRHGKFLPWVVENCPFSVRSAQVYTRLARNREKSAALAHLGLAGALDAMSDKKQQLPPHVRQAVDWDFMESDPPEHIPGQQQLDGDVDAQVGAVAAAEEAERSRRERELDDELLTAASKLAQACWKVERSGVWVAGDRFRDRLATVQRVQESAVELHAAFTKRISDEKLS
jgi:hypothetical protein